MLVSGGKTARPVARAEVAARLGGKAALPSPYLVNHLEIAGDEDAAGLQRGEQHGGARAAAVGVEEDPAGRAVVDDAVVGIAGLGAGDERAGAERAEAEASEDRVVERDLVGAREEVGEGIDIAAAERGGEGEGVRPPEPGQQVRAGTAVEDVGAGIADQDLAELVAGQIDRRGAAMVGGREHLDHLAGAEDMSFRRRHAAEQPVTGRQPKGSAAVTAGIDRPCNPVRPARFGFMT
jgi:hypothetical protein